MEYQYEPAVALLRRTPATVAALLRGLGEAWTTSTEGPETWSARDVVEHLLHAEEAGWNWIERARILLEHGEQRHIDSSDGAAGLETLQGVSLDELLSAFTQARARNLARLAEWHLTPELLARTGTHPELGTITLSQLLAAWVVHDLNHIGQIVEVLSHQYAEAVGPWRAYLAILTRTVLTD